LALAMKVVMVDVVALVKIAMVLTGASPTTAAVDMMTIRMVVAAMLKKVMEVVHIVAPMAMGGWCLPQF